MRVIGTHQRPGCNITLFHWNNKYLIKLEAGPFEQTFKIDEYDLQGDADLEKVLSDEFIGAAMTRFGEMSESLSVALQKR
ncbi:MAG: hypothetical protein AB7K37_11690 [Cyclobacteriaceae bacterium]